MTHGHTVIKSKGECIYCRNKNIKLTDEHIIPLSMGGFYIIDDASCEDCGRITTKFERHVAQGMWGDARNSYGAPSYRKKKREKYIFLDDQCNPGNKLKIPYAEYPAPMIFYYMDAAGFLLGLPDDIDRSGKWNLKAIVDENKLKSFEAKYPGQLTGTFRHSPDSFARLVAKIGYCQTMCSLDPDDFRPICLPYILGEKPNLSFIVGSGNDIQEPRSDIGYEMKNHSIGTSEYLLILSEIRIMANNHTPVYHVVVGDVVGKDKVEYVREKLSAVYTITIPDDTSSVKYPGEDYHWLPRIWPLPKN